MEFHYYYLIQDIAGILLSALALKMVIIYAMYMLRNKFSLNIMLRILGNIILILSGINLTLSPFGFLPWIISLVLFLTGCTIGTAAQRKVS